MQRGTGRAAPSDSWWTRRRPGIPAPRLIAAGVAVAAVAGGLSLAGGLAQAAAPEAVPAGATATSTPGATPGATLSTPGATPGATPTASPAPVISSVAYVGDSLTAGWNASTQANGFRALVSAGLSVSGTLSADSATAIAGATTGEVEATIGGRVKADLVIVALGTNDVGHKTPLAEFQTDYAAVLGTVQTDQLICVGVWRTDDRAAYDAVIRQLCDGADGTFVEIGDLREVPTMVGIPGQPAYPKTADGRHPSDAGHQNIAARILDAVE